MPKSISATDLSAYLITRFDNLVLLREEVGYTLWRARLGEREVAVHCIPEWSLREAERSTPEERFQHLLEADLKGFPGLLEFSVEAAHQIFLQVWTDYVPWEDAVLTRETALSLGVELCDLLAELHSRGIVHGDLSALQFGTTPEGAFCMLPCFKPPEEGLTPEGELHIALGVMQKFLNPEEFTRLSSLSSGREIARQLGRFLGSVRPEQTEPEMVGRDDALKQLNEAFQRGDMIAVEAPSGGGKSRLLSEWSRNLNARVLRGKASREVAPSPFRLFQFAFSTLERELSERPDWAQHLRWLIGEGNLREALGKQSHTQRSSMVWIAGLLEASHDDRPTVLILEDVHWADEFTMEFARFWGSEPRRALLVLSCRANELSAEHRYFSLGCTRVPLPPLSEEQARRVLRSIQPGASQVQIESSVKRAGGNPFLLSQLFRSGTVEGDLYRLRVSSMKESTRRTLAVASVLGDLVQETEVAQCMQTVPTFQEAVEQGVLERSGTSYRFTHDRFREACLSELPPGEWAAVHRRAAEHFSAQPDREDYQVAYHYHMAGEPERGADFALEAARRARREHDLNTGIFYFQVALAGLSEDDSRWGEVLFELGDGFRLVGRYRESEEHFLEALKRLGTPFKNAEILYALGDVYFKQDKLEDARRVLVEALAILGENQPRWLPASFVSQALALVLQSGGRGEEHSREKDLLTARLYNRLAYVGWFLEGPIPSIRAHLRELNIARKHGDSMELARAQANHAMAMSAIPVWSRALEFGKRARETAGRIGDPWCEGAVGHFYGAALLGACRLRQAREVLLEAREKIRQTGDRWEENGICYHLALVYYRLGALEKAAELARQTQRVGVEIADRLAAGDNLNTLARARNGEFPKELLEQEKRHQSHDVQRACEILCAEAIGKIRGRDYSRAVELLAEAQARYQAKGVRNLYAASIPCWLATAARLEMQEAPSGAREPLLSRLNAILEEALKQARRYRTNLPHALREGALVAILQGRFPVAQNYLQESIEFARAHGMDHEWKLSCQVWRHFGWGLGVTEFEAPALHGSDYFWLLGLPTQEGEDERGWNSLLAAATRVSQCLSAPTVLHQLYHGCRRVLNPANQCSIVQIGKNGEATELVGDLEGRVPGNLAGWDERVIPGFDGRARILVCEQHRCLSKHEKLFLDFLITVAGTVVDRARRTISTTVLSRDLQRSTDQLHEEAVRLLKAKEQLLLGERLALTGRLAAGLVHDLRNLVSGVNGSVEALALDNSTALRELHTILDAGRKSNQLLDRLSGVCKGEVLGVQSVSLRERISETAPLLRSLCGPLIELQFQLSEVPVVEMDPLLLDRILLNLVMNARDAVGSVGEVVVRTQEHRLFDVLEGFPQKISPGLYTVLEVQDDGPGIPVEVLPRIFDLHFTTKTTGVGVGLATVRELVEESRAQITVESRESGTRFKVFFPGR
ncbi:MAG: ATP-binding protein [Vulcanimicrobiota bacterium]